jgi:2-dehydropantoate 2-reductase
MSNNQPIYILGSGAIGCFIASFLYQANIPVVLLLKNSTQLQQYQQLGGIQLNYLEQKINCPVPAILVNECKNPTIILLTVKAFQLKDAIQSLQGEISDNTQLISFNNGLGWESDLKLNFIYSMHYCAAFAIKPFVIQGQNLSPIYLGNRALKNPPMMLLNFIENVKKSGLHFIWDENITLKRWEKLAINCIVNPLTAILGCQNGLLRSIDSIQDIKPELLNEVIQVAKACDLTLSYTALLDKLDTILAKTQYNYSSMLRDIQLHRRTEIDYLNGYIVQQAKVHALAVPYHTLLTSLIQAMEKNYEKNHFKNIN